MNAIQLEYLLISLNCVVLFRELFLLFTPELVFVFFSKRNHREIRTGRHRDQRRDFHDRLFQNNEEEGGPFDS